MGEDVEAAIAHEMARVLALQCKLKPARLPGFKLREFFEEAAALGVRVALPGLVAGHLRVVPHLHECGEIARPEAPGDESRGLEDHPNRRSIQSRVRK